MCLSQYADIPFVVSQETLYQGTFSFSSQKDTNYLANSA